MFNKDELTFDQLELLKENKYYISKRIAFKECRKYSVVISKKLNDVKFYAYITTRDDYIEKVSDLLNMKKALLKANKICKKLNKLNYKGERNE